jgi:hypothetical protein
MPRAKNDRTANRKAQIRCAIYTRKSSEEGLEQDFNSLDAQRESCEAFPMGMKMLELFLLVAMFEFVLVAAILALTAGVRFLVWGANFVISVLYSNWWSYPTIQ